MPFGMKNSPATFQRLINMIITGLDNCKSKKENPQKLTQLNSRSHSRHLVGKRTAQKDNMIDGHHKQQPGEQQFPIQVVTG